MISVITEYWVLWLMGLLSGGLIFFIKYMMSFIRQMKEAMQALLRNEILQTTDHYIDKGYAPIYARENVLRLYKPYHALGGNDVATERKEKMMALPEEPHQKQEEEK